MPDPPGDLVPTPINMFDYDDRGMPTVRRDIVLTPFVPTGPDFDGQTYDPMHDYDRLSVQLQDVWDTLTDDPERWWTLSDLRHAILGRTERFHTEAGISARLRDLRKPKFGRYTVQRKAVGGGLFRYRLDPTHYRYRLGLSAKEDV